MDPGKRYKELNQMSNRILDVLKFEKKPITREVLEAIMKVSIKYSSMNNLRPVEFIAIDGKEVRKVIEVIIEASRPNAPMLGPSHEVILNRIREKAPPLMVVVLADTRFKSALPETVNKEETIDMFVGASIQNMQLAIISLGLSSSWNALTKDESERLRVLMKVPEHMQLKSLVYIGYRDSEIRTTETRPLKEVLHYGKYDEKKGLTGDEVRHFIVTRTKGYGQI